MNDIQKLIEAVEAGAVISLNAKDVCVSLGWEFPDMRTKHILSAEIGSLDAAKALHEALLPGWCSWHLANEANFDGFVCQIFDGKAGRYTATSHCQTPARAWLIAILKAYKVKNENRPF